MSLRPVFGRSRKVALGWISFMYSGTMSIPTTAWPSSRSTEVTLPIWMPAMSTDWPWPGVTACAVENSAVMWSNSSPTTGSQDGSEAFCWVKIPSIITMPAIARTMIAIVSLRWPRAWRESQARKWVQRLVLGVSARSWVHTTAARGRADLAQGPVHVWNRVRVAAHVRLQRRHAAELWLGADRRRRPCGRS